MGDLVEFLCARIDEDERFVGPHLPTTWEARARAEVEAKRQIIEMWEDPATVQTLPKGVYDGRDPGEVETQVAVAETVDYIVRILTMAYADHEDYDPAWAPQEG